MNKCTATSNPSIQSGEESALGIATAADILLIADVLFGATLGYAAVHLYYFMQAPSLLAHSVGMIVWRQLILASVIAALVVRRAGTQQEKNDKPSSARSTILGVLGSAASAGTLLVAVGVVTGALEDLARLWLLVWSALFIAWMLFSRLLLLSYQRNSGVYESRKPKIAIIGARDCLTRLATLLSADTCVTAIIDHSAMTGHALSEALAQIVFLASNGAIGLVVLATDENEPRETLDQIMGYLKSAPIRIALCHSTLSAAAGSAGLLSVGGIPMSLISDRPLTRHDMLVKLFVDKLGALLLLVLALPLLMATALAILLETGGPIIFQQRRNGWCGRLFTIYKFRTMQHAHEKHVTDQTSRGDPRCTRVGALLRRTSLDELPQLWNVLLGDMSLVGPRPHADFLHARERVDCGPAADYTQRQRVKPGLTGWAQVHGSRGAIDTPEKLRQRVEFDRYYIENWSIWLDLKILAQTPWAVLSRDNAF